MKYTTVAPWRDYLTQELINPGDVRALTEDQAKRLTRAKCVQPAGSKAKAEPAQQESTGHQSHESGKAEPSVSSDVDPASPKSNAKPSTPARVKRSR